MQVKNTISQQYRESLSQQYRESLLSVSLIAHTYISAEMADKLNKKFCKKLFPEIEPFELDFENFSTTTLWIGGFFCDKSVELNTDLITKIQHLITILSKRYNIELTIENIILDKRYNQEISYAISFKGN